MFEPIVQVHLCFPKFFLLEMHFVFFQPSQMNYTITELMQYFMFSLILFRVNLDVLISSYLVAKVFHSFQFYAKHISKIRIVFQHYQILI